MLPAWGWDNIPPHGAGAFALPGHRSLGAGAHMSAERLLLQHRGGQSGAWGGADEQGEGQKGCPHLLVLTWKG